MDFWDFIYFYGLILAIAVMVLSLAVQGWMHAAFKKYSKVHASKGITGRESAETILQMHGLSGSGFGVTMGEKSYGYQVRVEAVGGRLSDHYSPKEKVVRLSESTYSSTSIAAIGVAAHECGHAIQDARSFIPNKIRAGLAPLAMVGSRFGPYLAIIGLFMGTGVMADYFFSAGIIAFSFATLFYVVTLPVEINASRRALKILNQSRLLQGDEIAGARKVLTAAAMTYVAAAAASVLTLLRLLAMRNRRR